MSQTSITPNIHHSLDIHLNVTAQITFNHQVLRNEIAQRSDLIFCKVVHFGARINLCGYQSLSCG
jgi:hypothetical protein